VLCKGGGVHERLSQRVQKEAWGGGLEQQSPER